MFVSRRTILVQLAKFVMQEDYNTFTDTKGTTHKIKLSRMSVGSFIAGYKRMCWRVSPVEMSIDQYILGKFTFDFAFKAGHAPEESLLYAGISGLFPISAVISN